MSRYSHRVVTPFDDILTIEYGHDLLSGYFTQVYHKGDILCEMDDLFGLQWLSEHIRATSSLGEYTKRLVVDWTTASHKGLTPDKVELMIRDPNIHLGARIAKNIKEKLNVSS